MHIEISRLQGTPMWAANWNKTMHLIIPLVSAAFFAGLVDSIAGGGGLISLPALLIAGVEPHIALGTNKIQSFFGTSFSMARYYKAGQLYPPTGVPAACGALVGSFMGARLALSLSADFLLHAVPFVVLGVGIFTFARPSFGLYDTFRPRKARDVQISWALGLIIGAYDGFFGPGTGTFLAFFFVLLFGFGFLRATAQAKLVNLASNVAAVAAFALAGKADLTLAMPMAAANIMGNWLGAGLAMRKGAVVIKPIFGLVLGGLLVKLLFFS
jgi:hypothetical protein